MPGQNLNPGSKSNNGSGFIFDTPRLSSWSALAENQRMNISVSRAESGLWHFAVSMDLVTALNSASFRGWLTR